jgi:hypothetical protein
MVDFIEFVHQLSAYLRKFRNAFDKGPGYVLGSGALYNALYDKKATSSLAYCGPLYVFPNSRLLLFDGLQRR